MDSEFEIRQKAKPFFPFPIIPIYPFRWVGIGSAPLRLVVMGPRIRTCIKLPKVTQYDANNLFLNTNRKKIPIKKEKLYRKKRERWGKKRTSPQISMRFNEFQKKRFIKNPPRGVKTQNHDCFHRSRVCFFPPLFLSFFSSLLFHIVGKK